MGKKSLIMFKKMLTEFVTANLLLKVCLYKYAIGVALRHSIVLCVLFEGHIIVYPVMMRKF